MKRSVEGEDRSPSTLFPRDARHVRRYGTTGPEIILLHGGPGAPGEVAPIGRELADAFRLVEPFQRMSASEPLTVARHVDDLHRLVVSGDVGHQPTVLGFSWGAMLGLAYAAAHPTFVRSLILVGCGTFDQASRVQLRQTLAARMNPEVRDAERRASLLDNDDERLRALAAAVLPLYALAPTHETLEIECVDARGHEESWNDMMRLQADGIYPAAFAAIKAPVLMLHGDFDPHPGPLIRANLQRYLPQLEYRELPRCGHYPWIERYAATGFYATIRDWMGRLAS